jgi:hypothetical protein
MTYGIRAGKNSTGLSVLAHAVAEEKRIRGGITASQ